VTVEIHGTGTHNRGAVLLAIAIALLLRARSGRLRLVVPRRFWSSAARARHGFLTTRDGYLGRRGRPLARFVPAMVWRAAGVVHPREVDVVLDASGFAFSDAFGADPATQLLDKMNEPHRHRQLLILLPQAMGPFEEPDVADACRRLLTRAELVFTRDPESLAAANSLGAARHLKLCPDFTQLVRGIPPAALPVPVPFVAIVPNIRMLDKTSDTSGETYGRFLADAVRTCERLGVAPLVVLHDAVEDRALLPGLSAAAKAVPVFTSDDPLVLKGVLGLASLVIGSRFHALVGAMSQGVPCIGAGWSHKYRWLFEDFGCPDHLLDDLADCSRADELIAQSCDPERRRELTARIRECGAVQAAQVASMWREVTERIGLA
jgi:polysaccharide pyruvyl transferase WcaK-like protein